MYHTGLAIVQGVPQVGDDSTWKGESEEEWNFFVRGLVFDKIAFEYLSSHLNLINSDVTEKNN